MRRWRLRGALWCMLLCFLLGGCGRCGDARNQPIASLSAISGPSVKRDYAARVHAWEAAQVGAQLALGDGAQTDAHTTAELLFINGARLTLQEGTTVRLMPHVGESNTGLDVETGRARLRVGSRGISLLTHVGLATIAPDSEIMLSRVGDGLGFDVTFGDVSFRNLDAEVVALGPGDSIDIGIGMAVLELRRAQRGVETPAETPALPDEEPPPRGPRTLEVTRGGVRLSEEGQPPRMLGRGKHTLEPGTQLRLAPGSVARLLRSDELARLQGAGDVLLGEDALLELKRGKAVMEANGADVVVGVPDGSLRAHGDAEGTLATVLVGPRNAKLTVARGRVTATLGGVTDSITAGSERNWTHVAAAAMQPGPSYHNMLARAGESFVVHAPEAPVAVGFDIGKCPGEGVLEMLGARQQARGTGSANLLFGTGIRGYTLRCIGPRGPGNIAARGTVHVLVDPGTRKLPTRAPTSNVEADGRAYTIYYQNQLPDVAVRWPNAPAEAQYQIVLNGTPTTIDEPAHLFTSGMLRDGTHTLSFQAGARHSRSTTVIVRFDNAAPKASLGAPPNRGFSPGDTVTVEGVALPGWRVALPGGSVQPGGADRFSGQVQTSKERPDIAVRLSHPRLGTHYYLRRAAGSP